MIKTNNSKKEFSRAQKVLVGGVNSPVRAFKSVGGQALIIDRGLDSKFYDIDGNAYTDYCLSWGALILGHAHKEVMAAVNKTLKNGTSYGTTTKLEIDLAETITKHVPSIDLIRFVNSGTEAVMSAIRLARGFTNRNKVLKFDGCYHGHCDDLLTSAGSGVTFLASSSSKGVPPGHVQNTLSIPYNDIQELITAIDRHRKDLACVILEPVCGNMGVVLPKIEFLRTIRDLTRRYGIVLIFDEVMTGFRTNISCSQSDWGIQPDLTCLGKIIGGGFPIGAYGGRRDIMQCLAPLGDVYQAGTFAGNPVVMAAGLATLKNLNASVYKQINQVSAKFAQETNEYFKEYNIPAHLSTYKSMMSLRFRKEIVIDYSSAQVASSHEIYPKLFHHLLNNGIYWPPADLEAFFISSKHTQKDLNTLKDHIIGFFQSYKPNKK
ncbi:MAG: glutamate-1-semialdehyde 2,1-aminomutase [Candidatus Omnitrophica bacterium]|nr:glutamate-1-semialdehyde 2,1-aminomutase [Candidatus Omnitrophota bacterium]